MVSNRPERTEPGARLVVDLSSRAVPSSSASNPAGSTTVSAVPPTLTVRQARPLPSGGPGPGTRWVVQFDEIAGRDDADRLRGAGLSGLALDEDPADGTLWVHHLVGSTVSTVDGTELGSVTAIVANPASDLMELAAGVLIPLHFVVDHRPGHVVVDVPAGLVD